MAIGTVGNKAGKSTRILDPKGQYKIRDLYDVFDEVDDGGVDQVRIGVNYKSKTNDFGQTQEWSMDKYQNADNFGEGTNFRDSILNYGNKKKEIAATRRAGYTSASSVLGGGAL